MSSASNIAITPTDLMIRKSSKTCAPATTALVNRKGKGGVILSKIHSLFVRSNKKKNETKLLFRPPSRLDSASRIKLTDIDEQDQVPCSSSSSSSTISEDTPPSPASGDDLSDVSDDSVDTSERPRQAMSQKEAESTDKSSFDGNSKDPDDPALASDDCFYPSTPDTLDSESTDSSFNSEMYVYDDPLVAAGEFFLPSLPDDDDDSTDDDVYVYDDPVIASDGRLFPSFPLASVKESESIASASSATNSRGVTDSDVAAVSDAITTYSTDSLWDSKCVAVDEIKWSQNPAPENPGFYTGPAKFGTIPHGLGRLSFVNGDTYHGPFRNGLKHGPNGVYITQNGSTYRGNYVDNKRHGHGQHMIATVVRYEGYFEAGLPNGFGRAHYDNGSLQYEGIWENGLPVNKMLLPFQGEEDSVISSGQLACDDASTTTSRSRMYSMYDPDKVPQGDDWTVESGFSDLTSIGGGSRWSITESTRSIDDDDDDESLSGGGGNEVSMYAPSLTRIDSRRRLPARSLLARRKNGSVGDLKPSSLYAAQRLFEVSI